MKNITKTTETTKKNRKKQEKTGKTGKPHTHTHEKTDSGKKYINKRKQTERNTHERNQNIETP